MTGSVAGQEGNPEKSPFEDEALRAPLSALDRFERLDMLDRVQGFLPTSPVEVTEATGLQSFIGKPAGAAKHLNEVAWHQKKAATDDHNRALRSITRSYIGFAVDAQQSRVDLINLQTELVEVLNPQLRLNRVFEPNQRGLLAFMRFFDLATIADQQSNQALGYDPLEVDYNLENPGIMFYLEQAMEQWRVHPVRKRLPNAITSEASRQQFWTERLEEVREHYPILRPIAEDGLSKLEKAA